MRILFRLGRRRLLGIFGLLLILTGVAWLFQGIGVLPGSFMTGQAFWIVAGLLAVASGTALVRRWRRKEPTSSGSNTGTEQPERES